MKEQFNQETLSRLRSYLAKRVNDPDEAEEIFADVLVAANDSWPLFRGESSFFTWLCSIANHVLVDYYRKKKIKTLLFSHFPFLEEIAAEALTPDDKLGKEELRKEVKKVLGILSEGSAEVLRLKYIDGLTVRQIAKKLKASFKSVESKLSRARESFKKKWLIRINSD